MKGLRNDLEQLQQDTSRFLASTCADFNGLAHLVKSNPSSGGYHVKEAKLGALAQEIIQFTQHFQKSREKYCTDYKEKLERQNRIRDSLLPVATKEDKGSSSGIQAVSPHEKQIYEEAQFRREELSKIETSIEDLSKLLQEMQLLIMVTLFFSRNDLGSSYLKFFRQNKK